MSEMKKCLKDMAVFSRLDDRELKLICENSSEKIYKKGELIFLEDDNIQKLYMLVEGRVKLTMLSPEGKEKVMTILQGGDLMGEISLFDHDTHPLTAEVIEDSRLLIISRSALENIIMEYPAIAIKIIEALAKKTRLLTSQIKELVFKNASGRLAGLLKRFSFDFGVEKNGGILIELVLTHNDIANLLGLSRVTVTKTINNFIDKGIIKIYKRKIFVKNQEKLESYLM